MPWLSGEEREVDGEGGADAGLGVADEDAAFVVLFDDAFGQGKAEAPSAFFWWCSRD